jgi:hypothetical protein
LPVFDLVRMEVALKVAQVAQQQRKHSEVSIYKEPGSEVYYYRAQVHGRRFKRSTGKTNYKEALVQAKVIARELRHDGQARTTMKRPGYASVGDLLAVWLERSPALTRGNNASTLRKWVRSFAGADADAVSMTRLTAEELERYLRAWPGSPEGTGFYLAADPGGVCRSAAALVCAGGACVAGFDGAALGAGGDVGAGAAGAGL